MRILHLETTTTLKTIPKDEDISTGHQDNTFLEVQRTQAAKKTEIRLLVGVLHDEPSGLQRQATFYKQTIECPTNLTSLTCIS